MLQYSLGCVECIYVMLLEINSHNLSLLLCNMSCVHRVNGTTRKSSSEFSFMQCKIYITNLCSYLEIYYKKLSYISLLN